MDQALPVFEGLFQASPDVLLVVDLNGKITLVNERAKQMFGYERAELLGRPVELLVPERLRHIHAKDRSAYQAHPATRSMGAARNICGRRKDGSEFPLDIQISPLPTPNGVWTLAVIRDISDRIAMQEALHTEQERYQVTLESIGDAVLSIDLSGNISYLNKVAEKMTGWPRAEALGRPLPEVFRVVSGDTRDTVPDPVSQAMRKGPSVRLAENWILIDRDGMEKSIEDSAALIHNTAGCVIGAVIVFHDVSASRAMANQMSYLAQHDPLTNLPNRMLLNDRLSHALSLAERHGTQLAVLFLDLDSFKHINDSLGHSVGDKLLQSVADRLKAAGRGSDTISRTGGDEFIILLPDIEQAHHAAFRAEKILAALGLPHRIAGHELHVTTSVGISIYPNDGRDVETLIKNADMAMYHAKNSGRNNHQFFTQDMNQRSMRRQIVESGLRRALEQEEFVLYYQPKVNLDTGATIGAEALIRWRSPNHELILPSQFIPVAEETGLILSVGKWVLREACRQIHAWQESNLQPVPVSVNISAMEFHDKHFMENLRAVLGSVCIDPYYLELELTESVLMQHVESTAAMLQELKRIGVRLAVDDFGTGYSSLSYLRNFPIDVLKIDQSFIHEISNHPNNATIVDAVIGMCRGLQCRVIAEGVETQEQVEILRAHRCGEAQGYYFGRPMEAEEFAKQLAHIR